MVRLKGRDNLDNLRGVLATDFRAVHLSSLHAAFLKSANSDKKEAARALEYFYQAAGKLHVSEKKFKGRARTAFNTQSIMTHLREPAHFTALREFSAAKEGLLGINAGIGQSIIRLAERDLNRAAPAIALSSAP